MKGQDLPMTRKEKARRVAAVLDRLYPEPAAPLRRRDAYTLLVATVLSAQCTDVRVNAVAPRLFARASTPAAMARLSPAAIAEIIRPCGLAPAKSKAIAGLSAILCERFGGRVPATFAELESLPGVGHKTASVVMAQAFGAPAFPVDTHVHRLARRWGLSSGESVARTERDLKALYPEAAWHRIHLQMILFGRERCPARGHAPAACPICSFAAPRSRAPRGSRAGSPGTRRSG
jgi:endonuclease-3